MKWINGLVLTGIAVIVGCAGKPTTPVKLVFKQNPPVMPYDPDGDAKPRDRQRVEWFAYDLKQDGKLEYFINVEDHANKVSFTLIDDQGSNIVIGNPDDVLRPEPAEASSTSRPSTGPTTRAAIGDDWTCCDQLLILNSKHEGYFDILTICTYLCEKPMQHWELWVHHDGYYYGCDWNGGMVFTPEGFRLLTPDYEYWKGPEDVNPFDVRAYWNCDALPYGCSGPVLKPVPTPPHWRVRGK